MHSHGVAHLDISLGNILTDCEGNYIYIDFETSRRYDRSIRLPRISGCRGTEIPPDVEGGEESCPFKIDVFALGVLFLRACKVRKTASENFLHCIIFFLPPFMSLVLFGSFFCGFSLPGTTFQRSSNSPPQCSVSHMKLGPLLWPFCRHSIAWKHE